MDCTTVSSVQHFGRRALWPRQAVYVGMPGSAATAFGIPRNEGLFGKPWDCLRHPLGWQTGYLRYLVDRLSKDPWFEGQVKALHGRTLLCWCSAKGAEHCHAQILAEFVELLNHAA